MYASDLKYTLRYWIVFTNYCNIYLYMLEGISYEALHHQYQCVQNFILYIKLNSSLIDITVFLKPILYIKTLKDILVHKFL